MAKGRGGETDWPFLKHAPICLFCIFSKLVYSLLFGYLLQLVNGMPHLGYRCQSSFSGNLSSNQFVSDRAWHSVLLEVKSNSIHLLADSLANVSLQLPEACSISHSWGDLLIGGFVQHHHTQKIISGFRGCLDAITVDGREVVVLPREKRTRGVVEEASIRQCCHYTGVCGSNPCLNDGLCTEIQDGGMCCFCNKGLRLSTKVET